MSKRNARNAQGLPGENELDDRATTLEELARAGYGLPADLGESSGRVVSRPTPLFDISPDPRQPRRTIPATVRSRVVYPPPSEAEAKQLFDQWAGMAFREGAGHRPRDTSEAHSHYRALVMGEPLPETEDEPPRKIGPLESSFVKVVDLATAIRRDGLTNPITVTRDGTGWLIETGERRWLAYHLLHYYEPDNATWAKIPAREVQFDVWRQATENNQRSDLNAIGRARQFAILLIDLLAAEGVEFRPFTAFRHEQDYYAQVADSGKYRIPRGKADQLLNAMGIKTRQSLNYYRQLLSLPHSYWEQGDDEGWAINDLLPIVKSFDNSPPDDQPDDDAENVHSVDNSPPQQRSNLPASQPRPPAASPPRTRFGVGAEVVTDTGQRGMVTQIISPLLVRVRTANGIRNYNVATLAPAPPFDIGEAVQVDRTGEIGEVAGGDADSVVVRIDGQYAAHYDPRQLTALGMTWEEYTQDEIENDDVSFEGEEVDESTQALRLIHAWEGEWCPRGMTGADAALLRKLVVEDRLLDMARMRATPTGPLIEHYRLTAEGYAHLDYTPDTQEETLYPESPSSDEWVERARQVALQIIGDSHQQLDDKIRGRTGTGGPDGPNVNFGGGKVWLDYGTSRQRPLDYARNQVAVTLRIDGWDRLFRFNAKRLMDWKLSNIIADKDDSRGSGGDQESNPDLARHEQVLRMLRRWQEGAADRGDQETVKVIDEIINVEADELQRIAQAGGLSNVLSAYYEHLAATIITVEVETELAWYLSFLEGKVKHD